MKEYETVNTALEKKRKTTYGSQVDKVVKREISVALWGEYIRQALLEWIALVNAKREKNKTMRIYNQKNKSVWWNMTGELGK